MSTPRPRRQRPAATPPPRQRAGAHRGGSGVLAALLPSVLAVAAVASLVTALAVWQGETPDQPRAAASTTRAGGDATGTRHLLGTGDARGPVADTDPVGHP